MTVTTAPTSVRDLWPVTPLQEGMLFHSVWESEAGERPTYQLQFGVELEGAVAEDALREALADLLDAHENLAVAFAHAGLEQPVQIVPEHAEVPVRTVVGDDLDALAREEWDAGFDLTRPPLLRALLARTTRGTTWLLVTAHHLVIDGWSVPLFLRELLARLAGDEIEEPVADYLDYLDHLDEADPGAARSVLLAELSGVTEGTLVAPADPGGEVTTEVIELDADVTTRLDQAARGIGVTPAAVVQAAWGVVVGAATGRDDVVVGTVTSGRDLDVPGIEDVLGLVSNTLPLRLGVPYDASLAEVAREAHRRRAALLEASTADLRGVQAEVGVAPLFDTLVVVENYPGGVDEWRSADGSLRVIDRRADDAVHYPLSLLAELTETWRLEVASRPAAFASRPRRWAIAQLERVLRAFAADPATSLVALDLVTSPPEGLVGAPMTATGDDLLARVREVRTQRPDAPAVVEAGRVWTVAELHAFADALRAALPVPGGLGAPVAGLLLDRSADLVAAVAACLTAGVTFVPLDPDQPDARLAAMIDDAGIDVIVTCSAHAERASSLHSTILSTDDLAEADGSPPVSRPASEAAYIVFTSGTTGRPKGCVNTLDGLANRVTWMAERYGIGADDVVLHKTPLSFDVAVWELVLPLVTGSTCVIARSGEHRDPEAIDALVREHGVTVLHFVPSMLAALLDLVPRPVWPTVRAVLCSGEALSTSLAARAHDTIGSAIHNLYGPAEAAIDVTAADHVQAADGPGAPIGTAVPGVTLRVLDPWLRPVDLGATGELYLGGTQVGRGYAGRPALTAERFVADPLGTGERLYRTGDLVTPTAGGLRYVGRSDDQVKIHGVRIETGEIADAVAAAPGVTSAVADVVDGVLVAWATGKTTSESILRDLADRLPAAMQPGRVTVVDSIPTTANGKADRAALAGLLDTPSGSGREPIGPTEQAVAEVAANILRLDQVDPEADLFTLGLDSITAIALIGRLRERGWDASLREVFAHRTIERLSSVMATDPAPVADRPATELDVDDATRSRLDASFGSVERVLPLGPLQEGLYVHREMGGRADELDPYIVQHQLTLGTEVDPEALAAAGEALLRRHQSLRAGFTHHGFDRPVAVILAPGPMPLEQIDLSGLDAQTQEERLEGLLERQVAEGFDLSDPPLIRMVLVRLGPARFRISLVHHHILTDGWSQTLVLEDLMRLYDIAVSDPARPVSDAGLPPTADYADYLDWVAAQDHDEAMAAWSDELSGLDEPTLVEPRSLTTPPVLSDSVTATLDAATSDALRSVARGSGVTLSTALSYAWAHVLRSVTGRDDVVFGTTVSGRPAELEHVDRMVGLLMNTVPVRVAIDPAARVADQLREQLGRQAGVMGAHHLGLGWIGQAAGHSALFDTLYVFRNIPADEEEQDATFARHRIEEAEAYDGTHYSLALTVNPGEEPEVALAFRPDLIDASRAAALLDRYLRALDTLGSAQYAAQVRVDVPAERPVIERVNREATTVPDSHPWTSVDARLAASAQRTPDVTALVGRDLEGEPVSLSLGEVERRVASLATLIDELTSGPESVVALALPRAVDHVIAIFATLRAGRTYLPLDMTNPPERLRRLAGRAGAELVLSTPSLAETTGLGHVAPVLVSTDPEFAAALRGARPAAEPAPVRPDQAAYVIYTSGSTGEPKAVVVPHRGLSTMHDNHVAAIFAPALERAGAERFVVAHTVSFSFDMSWEEFFWLMDGHEVHVIDEGLRLDVPRLVEHYRAIGVDVVNVTPSYGRELMAAGLLDDPAPALVLLGGEPVPPELWTRLREHPRSSGYDLYGPTEFTINALGADLAASEHPSLGRPIARSVAYVLDTSLAEVPPGGTGELYLAGDGLARGYLGASALTAERFVADPFAADGSRLYRTGDLVTRRHDGGIEYRGRNDAQLKIRGFRVELGEIEAVAEEHGSVRRACASVHRTQSGVDVLRLHVVTADGKLPEDLGAHLAAVLPAYAVPSQLGAVDAIPLTSNGKADRRALPELSGDVRREPPRTALESELCRIFGEVLGAAVTSRDDGFFDLGGHSLAAMRVVAAISDELGIEVRVGTLMVSPTPASLAAVIREPAAEAGLGRLLMLRDPGSDPTVFCVHPAGGFAWQFAPLLPHLPAGTGAVGLQAPELSGGTSAAATIGELAVDYLDLIRSVQPHGPYRLLGYSYGGNIAHEIAARLVSEGDEVELLGLIDPGPLGGDRHALGEADIAALRDEQSAFLTSVAAVDAETDRVEALAAIRASQGALGDRVDDTIVEAIVEAHRSASELMSASVSPRTSVPTLLIASDLDGDPFVAWGDLLGDDVEVHRASVGHDELVRPAQWARFGPIVARRLSGAT
ncbi:amino acid adenylation domain-containing protein [Aeromicrobium sp. YIM 150415]|uniref:non-ribosomal peptide synthetase n=1 Tax=Aeromicrobium sp. YIM 150415 TaxID=2803912 RepID=UPI00196607D2|nr:non-ribosomal peptide synthetase [Aeromicrobium sp. YIM 150415]MBM9464445.1 amino acid adenylation domain-containing protein [Aeromicrobium sp. YIM 150415]